MLQQVGIAICYVSHRIGADQKEILVALGWKVIPLGEAELGA